MENYISHATRTIIQFSLPWPLIHVERKLVSVLVFDQCSETGREHEIAVRENRTSDLPSLTMIFINYVGQTLKFLFSI